MKLFLDYLFIYQPPTSVSKHPSVIATLTPNNPKRNGFMTVNVVNAPMVIHRHHSVAMMQGGKNSTAYSTRTERICLLSWGRKLPPWGVSVIACKRGQIHQEAERGHARKDRRAMSQITPAFAAVPGGQENKGLSNWRQCLSANTRSCRGRGGCKTPSTFRARPFAYLRSQDRNIDRGGVSHAY